MKSRLDWMMGFGGPWTTEKLDILERYLNSYTTALKNQPFGLVYIDAFAGSGEINIGECGVSEFDSDSFVTGSTERALRVVDRPFDQLVFVEKQADSYDKLVELKSRHPDRLIDVEQDDANTFLAGLTKHSFLSGPATQTYVDWRGVLFVDPFGTELAWATVQHIAEVRRLDMWLLFPVGAIGRMLPLSGHPDEVEPKWVDKDYILVMLFLKYISDLWDEHVETYRQCYGGDEARIRRRLDRERFVLPESARFRTLYEQRNEPNLGELINIALEDIEDRNRAKLEGVFRNIDFNSEANLGRTKDRSRRLKNLLEDFAKPALDLRPSRVTGDVIGECYIYLISRFASDRGHREGRIRRALIEENLLDAVIGLPAKLFTTIGIPVAILVLDRSREEGGENEDRFGVLFIDASKEFTPGKKQNVMEEEHIAKVVATYRKREAIERYSHVAAAEEIIENDYNLNIPRYVDTFEPEEKIDIADVQREIYGIEAELVEVRVKMRGYLRELGLEV